MDCWKVLVAFCLVATLFTRGSYAALQGFTISPSYFISGISRNLTLRCDLGPYIHAVSTAMVLQLSKLDQQSVATLVTEQQSGSGPTLVATSLKDRSFVEGKMDPADLPGTYIQLTLMRPEASDSGQYMCSMTVMDHTNFVMTLTFNASVSLENATVNSLLDHVNDLHQKIEQVTDHLLASTNLNKALEKRLDVLEGEFRNSTQESVMVGGEMKGLREDVRLLQSDLAQLTSDKTCPSKCMQELDSLEARHNSSREMFMNDLINMTQTQAKRNQVVFFTIPTNVPKGLIALNHAEIVKFQEVILNVGGGYRNSTGTFIAPVSGTYVFMLNVPIIDKDPTRQFNIALTVNFDQTIAQIENDNEKTPSSVTVVRHLPEGSKVSLYSFQLAGSQGTDTPKFSRYSSYFGGFLLYED